MKYINEIRKKFRKLPLFKTRDAVIIITKMGGTRGYAYLLLNHLAKRGEITRITKGYYSFEEEIEVCGFAYSPFYYGLQEALSLRNLWEQETNPVIITTRKTRTGLKKILGKNVLIRRISQKMFFGFEMVKYYDFWVPVSDVEKTLIDFIYFGEYLNEETLTEIKKNIKMDKLKNYLKKVPKRIRNRVLEILKK
jgi:predicted transcriptional regulator of viral defense system